MYLFLVGSFLEVKKYCIEYLSGIVVSLYYITLTYNKTHPLRLTVLTLRLHYASPPVNVSTNYNDITCLLVVTHTY